MPATRNFPPVATARQVRYINALLAERNTSAVPSDLLARIVSLGSGQTSSREASMIIESLMACPRAARVASQRLQDGEDVPTPSVGTRAGRMLLAGGVEATVTLPSGEHMTIRITTRHRVGRGWGNCGPQDEGARTNISILGRKVGWVNVTESGAWMVTFCTTNVAVTDAVRALFGYARHGMSDGLRGGDRVVQWGAYRVQEASRCGRCMRTLTDPVSIDRGIGPECFGRTTDSHHAAVVESTSAEDAATVEERMIWEVAEREAQQERAAYENEMREERALNITPAATSPQDSDVRRARDLIAEALDAYSARGDARFALQIFDRLARS